MAASLQHKVDNQSLAFSLKAKCLSLGTLKQGFGDRMFSLTSATYLVKNSPILEGGWWVKTPHPGGWLVGDDS